MLARQLVPCQFPRIRRQLMRRHERRIPGDKVASSWSYDAALQLEAKLAARRPGSQHAVARWRTRRFDRTVARAIERRRPGAALLFSDVGSDLALPTCRRLGIPSILSMVHGDVREERRVLDREAIHAPDFFPIYLGDGKLDRAELDWLHQRRLRDIALADRILVPSDHIAGELVRHGTPRERIGVVPYAADTKRFRPDPAQDRRPTAAPSSSPAGSPSGRGSSTSSKPGGGPPARLAACNSSGPCRATRGRSGRTWLRSTTSGEWAMPRCPRGWRRPTSSSSRRCSRGRRS